MAVSYCNFPFLSSVPGAPGEDCPFCPDGEPGGVGDPGETGLPGETVNHTHRSSAYSDILCYRLSVKSFAISLHKWEAQYKYRILL